MAETHILVLKDGGVFDVEDEAGNLIVADLAGPPDMGPGASWLDHIIEYEKTGENIPTEREKIIRRTMLAAANRPDQVIRDERS